MRYAETLPEFYPALCPINEDGKLLFSFPDFPELLPMPMTPVEAQSRLAWAIGTRRANHLLLPFPSHPDSLKSGPVEMVKVVLETLPNLDDE